MSDRRHPENTRSTQERTEQTQRLQQSYRPPIDPAYSGQPSYPPPYYPRSSQDPNSANPTDRLPQYWQHGQPSTGPTPQDLDPDKPKAPRWLWIAAGAAVLLVAGLVIALVIANGTASKQTAVPALPSSPSSPRPIPVVPRSPSHKATTEPSQPVDPGSMQTVLYNVSGDGRAISITYVDNDGMMQTEFNVALPWIKEVSLPESGSRTPNVTIVNIGHDVTCSVTVDGVEINQRSGVGLTICNGNG
ncbi:MmpS family transport accessory protein [Candidatus Mycobacterium wuenschmannii]|uniref:MmpS family transport accessory protein n=1 Tax=Candidatus Mycobacterium wuenschmannii TaxID=3027808 RepID=A0ABY8W2V5_9MYCO|nr:MmpS family transport accessory protein [Candidatus Mycobacterium wuenschmannii]WIM89530.1 MmpS family transport accessory protein [Candidatus Mycobacterium wuenschmannii]